LGELKKMNVFEGKDMVTLKGIQRDDLELLFNLAQEMEAVVKERRRIDLLDDKVLGLAFFQVSTRTRISFESAMVRLGGAVVGFVDPKTTRAGDYYAESLHDVIRMMESYSDVIVIRHPTDGAPAEAAAIADVPVISGGDGYNEHPTQSLLDVFTILQEKGTVDGLNIALVGDMNMRVMHALPLALAQYQTHLYFVSPQERSMPQPWLDEYQRVGLNYEEHQDLEEILDKLDVIYLMGTKTPSYAAGRTDTTPGRPETPKPYVIDPEKLNRAKPGLIVLHPLPRTDELPKEVDALKPARYFEQAHYGVAVRMALLALMMGRIHNK
jgi:aspartate carbamoyltransferase catalytic subunit